MNTEKADSNEIESGTAGNQADKRFADSVGPGGRPLKLDRRTRGRDRRMNNSQDYRGKPRRVTIDRRNSSEERRDEN